MTLTAHERVGIKPLRLSIDALTVDGKAVTLAVWKQIPRITVGDVDEVRPYLDGIVGWVNVIEHASRRSFIGSDPDTGSPVVVLAPGFVNSDARWVSGLGREARMTATWEWGDEVASELVRRWAASSDEFEWLAAAVADERRIASPIAGVSAQIGKERGGYDRDAVRIVMHGIGEGYGYLRPSDWDLLYRVKGPDITGWEERNRRLISEADRADARLAAVPQLYVAVGRSR